MVISRHSLNLQTQTISSPCGILIERTASKETCDLLNICILICTLVLYWDVLNHEFLNYDDHIYVSQNPRVLSGLTLENIGWAFHNITGFYHPVTWISLMFDASLFKASAGGYHTTNLVLHLVNVALVFRIIQKLTGSAVSASFAGVVFAFHPVNVETVCWISERKGLLGTAFMALAFLGYISYRERPGFIRYLNVFLLLLLSLASKPVALCLPIIFLLYDWVANRRARDTNVCAGKTTVLNKVPFLAICALWVILTFIAENNAHALVSFENRALSERLQWVPAALSRYVVNMFFPFPYSIPYIRMGGVSYLELFSALGALTLLTLFGVAQLRSHGNPLFLFGFAWFVIALLPISGIVQIGVHALADRYLYPAELGFLLAIVSLRAFERNPTARAISFCILAGILAVWTTNRILKWRNAETLFSESVSQSEDNFIAHLCLAYVKIDKKEWREAKYHLLQSVAKAPRFYRPYLSLADVLVHMNAPKEAIRYIRIALKNIPQTPVLHLKLADLITRQDGLPESEYKIAIGHAKLAATLPGLNRVDCQVVLGAGYARIGDYQPAVRCIEEAILLDARENNAKEANRLWARRDYYIDRLASDRTNIKDNHQ